MAPNSHQTSGLNCTFHYNTPALHHFHHDPHHHYSKPDHKNKKDGKDKKQKS